MFWSIADLFVLQWTLELLESFMKSKIEYIQTQIYGDTKFGFS